MKVAIIGAGVIGLGIGWRLAQRGIEVTLFERGAAGEGASYAAAGMLAAACETEPGEAALGVLNRASMQLWPDFALELEHASGMSIGLRREGTLVVALNRDDGAKLRHDMAFLTTQGVSLEWLTPAEAREREPFLAPKLAGAIFSPADVQVDNRAVVRALLEAFRRAGGVVRENTTVDRVHGSNGRVAGVFAANQLFEADVVVLAAGAWSGGIGLPVPCPSVRPIKGQMLAVQMDPSAPLLRHVVWAPRAYMVPRLDGRLIIGGTVEEKGFNSDITAGGVYALLDGAWRALPGIEELKIIETWVGFRPGSRDDAPILGASALPGLMFATGHHRNGILLTPITADAMASTIIAGKTDERIAAFGADRFEQRRNVA